MRPRVRTVLIVLLTVGLLAYFLRDADMREVWAETRRADPWALVLAVGATAITYVVRALRWQYLLAPIGHVRFVTAFRTTVIGFAANTLLPAWTRNFGAIMRNGARWSRVSAKRPRPRDSAAPA